MNKQLEIIDVSAKNFSVMLLICIGIGLNIPAFVLTFQMQSVILSWSMRIISLVISILLIFGTFSRNTIGRKFYDYKKMKLMKKWEIDKYEDI